MMFQHVRLAEIARPISRTVDVLPGQKYRTMGVKWWGEGAYERETIDGSRTAAKMLNIVRADDLIINKIWVRHGSTAVASSKVDGCAASGEFPMFELDRARVLPRWVHWITKTRDFWTKCDSLSRGTSGKNRIKPELFLTIDVPLPPLEEQRRIVARVEAMAAKIEEARGLRQKSLEAVELAWAAGAKVTLDRLKYAPHEPLGSFVKMRGGGTPSKSDPTFWGGHIPWVSPKDMKVRELHDAKDHITETATARSPAKLIEPGAVLIVVRGMILVHTVPVAILRKPAAINQDMKALIPDERITPEYLSAWLWARNGDVLSLVEKSTHDTRKLETDKLSGFPIAIPGLAVQREIVVYLDSIKARVDELEQHQKATKLELDALLPSILSRAFAGEL